MFDRCEDTMPTVWGPWQLDRKANVLLGDTGFNGRYSKYEIDLDRCQTLAQKCDWLAHIAEKSWATPAVLGYLVRALDETVGLRPLVGKR